jgi:hypothetical protein
MDDAWVKWALLGGKWRLLGVKWPLLGVKWPFLGVEWALFGRKWLLPECPKYQGLSKTAHTATTLSE